MIQAPKQNILGLLACGRETAPLPLVSDLVEESAPELFIELRKPFD